MPRALPAPLTAFSVRMVMADGALYIRSSGEALIYLGGRAVDRSREGALASEAELSLIDEAATAVSDEAALPRAEGGWECVGEGMIGAYVDRTVSLISSLTDATHVPTPVSVEDPTGLLTSLLERLGVPIDRPAPASSMNASDQASARGAGERWRFEYASPSSSEPDGADAGVAASRFVPRSFEIRRMPW